MFKRLITSLKRFIRYNLKLILGLIIGTMGVMVVSLIAGKVYQHWDNDPDRGAIAMEDGLFGESYDTPIYLEQGWDRADSLWFYNTTQGSVLMPYDLFMEVEQADSTELFRANKNIDRYRYLPQKPTFFNPEGLPVGIVKDEYRGKDYIGFTCAACHTGQINYQGQAIRIDGGPAMADMVGFLTGLEASLKATLENSDKQERFVTAVLERDNNYDSKDAVLEDLQKWTTQIHRYNTANNTDVDYGYARLDAFGRIFNRVLEHVINRRQLRTVLLNTTDDNNRRILTMAEADQVLEGLNETVIGNEGFAKVIARLKSTEPGYPGLNEAELKYIRQAIYNEPNAPVSYPFLWGIAQSDYVQWNGIASNAGLGPLGRNTGEVLGVFAKLDWKADDPGFSLAGMISGQSNKNKDLEFDSSVNKANLQRLESHLKHLISPQWPEDILGKIDCEQSREGELIYAEYCQSCHERVDRTAWDRRIVATMSAVDKVNTDPAMAENSVKYSGKAGNFQNTYQDTSVGPVLMEETAPAAMILTAASRGVVATPDRDKWWIRRQLDWLYVTAMSFFDNEIKPSVKKGNYKPDTTANPYNSLLAYKARSLNGIWATAPYLHNGSVPTLYDLLLPVKREGDPEDGEYRPESFKVGSREFDPVKVGFRTEGYDGFEFTTELKAGKPGDLNTGHQYAAGRTPQLNGEVLPALTKPERWALVEFLKDMDACRP